MTVIVVTTCEGTPAALDRLVDGARGAATVHREMGARNIRLLRSSSGGDPARAHYYGEFDSHEAYGAFWDKVLASDWFKQAQQATAEGHPNIRIASTAVYYDALATP